MLHLTNRQYTRCMVLVLFCIFLTQGVGSEESPSYVRIPLSASAISFDLGDTSKDYDYYDKDGKKVYVDSEASYTFDADDGSYSFKYNGPSGNEDHTAYWIPRRYVKATVFARVTRNEEDRVYRYEYAVEVSENSKQSVERFAVLPGVSGKIGANSDSVRSSIA